MSILLLEHIINTREMDPQSQHFKTENKLSNISVKNDISSIEISLKCSNDDYMKPDQLQIQSNAK